MLQNMNYQSKYRENERLLEGYVAFLDECTTYDDKLKLSVEIGHLDSQKKQIAKMEYANTKSDISNYELKIPACI